MSAKNRFQSLADRERVPKIQGLVNECMTFLDDELSVITGLYEDLLSIDEVIEQELILFVTLNVNKNTEPVLALGKMLLQNLHLAFLQSVCVIRTFEERFNTGALRFERQSPRRRTRAFVVVRLLSVW